MSTVSDNLTRLRLRIADCAKSAGRRADDVGLVAVTKTFPREVVSLAVEAGQLNFGENRVQEAETKIPYFRGNAGLQWHLVGHLQSNKARRAAELFDVVHSVDSEKVARRLSEAAAALDRTIAVLIQVDLGEEATKWGTPRSETMRLAETCSELPGLRLDGLMTIPPFFDDPERTRPFFRELREIKDDLESAHPGVLGSRHLSMGMSHDFEIAIEEGATLVRIGTAIFGERTRA